MNFDRWRAVVADSAVLSHAEILSDDPTELADARWTYTAYLNGRYTDAWLNELEQRNGPHWLRYRQVGLMLEIRHALYCERDGAPVTGVDDRTQKGVVLIVERATLHALRRVSKQIPTGHNGGPPLEDGDDVELVQVGLERDTFSDLCRHTAVVFAERQWPALIRGLTDIDSVVADLARSLERDWKAAQERVGRSGFDNLSTRAHS